MELNLVLSTLRNIKSSNEQPQPQRTLLEGCSPRVEWRETRSSYFLNLNLQGLRRDDVQLEMDNRRAMIIRGQRYVQDIGIVRWRWRLVEQVFPSSSRRSSRPFRIPEDVNVGAITARFHHGILHVDMPKLRRTNFTPYQIPIHSCDHENGHICPLNHGEQEPQSTSSVQGETVKELRDENMESESVLPRPNVEENDLPMIITVEDQNIPTVPEEPNKDEKKQLPEVYYVSPPQHQLSASEIMDTNDENDLPCSYSKGEYMQEMEQGHDAHPCPSEKGAELAVEEQKRDNLGEGSNSDDEKDYCVGREHWRPMLCKGLCQLLECLGVSTACRLKRRRDAHESQSEL